MQVPPGVRRRRLPPLLDGPIAEQPYGDRPAATDSITPHPDYGGAATPGAAMGDRPTVKSTLILQVTISFLSSSRGHRRGEADRVRGSGVVPAHLHLPPVAGEPRPVAFQQNSYSTLITTLTRPQLFLRNGEGRVQGERAGAGSAHLTSASGDDQRQVMQGAGVTWEEQVAGGGGGGRRKTAAAAAEGRRSTKAGGPWGHHQELEDAWRENFLGGISNPARGGLELSPSLSPPQAWSTPCTSRSCRPRRRARATSAWRGARGAG